MGGSNLGHGSLLVALAGCTNSTTRSERSTALPRSALNAEATTTLTPSTTALTTPKPEYPKEVLFGASLRQVDLYVGLVGSVLAGPGSDLSKESVVGVEPAALDFVVAPGCPPGPVAVSGCASRTRRR